MHGAADLAENSRRFRSHRQVQLIRSALAAYRDYTPGQTRSHMTWPELAGIIEADTGVEFGAEALRRFIDGSQVPQPERLDAIVNFLTQPEVAALDLDELEGNEISVRAPRALAQYLMQSFDAEPVAPPATLAGSYRTRLYSDGAAFVVDLTLDIPAGGDLMLATEIAHQFDHADVDRLETTDEREWSTFRKGRRVSSGWGVVTPEDNLLLFMKRRYHQNHYWSRVAEIESLTGETVSRLVLLRQQYPPEVDESAQDDDVLRQAVMHALSQEVGIFRRY